MKYFKAADIPTLDRKEINSIIKESKQGDISNLGKFIRFYLPKILKKGRFMCQKYTTRKLQASDLVVAGIKGLTKSIKKFDPSKNTKFWTYANYNVEYEMSKEIFSNMYPITTTRARQNLAKKEDKMNHNTFIQYDEAKFPVYEKKDPYKLCEQKDSKCYLKKTMKRLPRRDQEMLIDRFYGKLTLSAIGDRNNRTGAAIRQSINKTLKVLKKELKED